MTLHSSLPRWPSRVSLHSRYKDSLRSLYKDSPGALLQNQIEWTSAPPPWQSEHYALTPIDGPPAKPTTALGSSNYLAKGVPFHPHGCTVIPGGHSTNMSLQRGTQENGLSPLKYHKIIIGITSSYHKYSCHVHWLSWSNSIKLTMITQKVSKDKINTD
jgi:hypothetical protein